MNLPSTSTAADDKGDVKPGRAVQKIVVKRRTRRRRRSRQQAYSDELQKEQKGHG